MLILLYSRLRSNNCVCVQNNIKCHNSHFRQTTTDEFPPARIVHFTTFENDDAIRILNGNLNRILFKIKTIVFVPIYLCIWMLSLLIFQPLSRKAHAGAPVWYLIFNDDDALVDKFYSSENYCLGCILFRQKNNKYDAIFENRGTQRYRSEFLVSLHSYPPKMRIF